MVIGKRESRARKIGKSCDSCPLSYHKTKMGGYQRKSKDFKVVKSLQKKPDRKDFNLILELE